MKIEYLDEFIDLASTLSYSETAVRMSVGESTLSRHIKTLEEELDVALFERTSRRVRLSADGRVLLDYARPISERWSAYQKDVRAARTRSSTTLSIGTNYFIGDLVAKFLAKRPDRSVNLVSQGDANAPLLESLDAGVHQFVVVTSPEELPPHVGSTTLAEDSFVVALPSAHRFAGEGRLDLARLSGEHFISFREDSVGDAWLKAVCRGAGFEPEVILTADVGSSIAQFVRDGVGIAVLQQKTIAKMMTGGVAYVTLTPSVQISAVLCWDRRVQPTATAREFMDFVADGRRGSRAGPALDA